MIYALWPLLGILNLLVWYITHEATKTWVQETNSKPWRTKASLYAGYILIFWPIDIVVSAYRYYVYDVPFKDL